MLSEESYLKIILKKDFSKLPRGDVEIAYSKFEKRQVSEDEKIRLTRDLLRKVFSGFASGKLLSLKNKSEEWVLRKHLSTRERLPYYDKVYSRILNRFKEDEKISIVDLGSGVNGFSYNRLVKRNPEIDYLAIEAVGQLVDLMNDYFKRKKFNAIAIHKSLFEIDSIKKIIKKTKGAKILFLFKVLDSLEMLGRDYSKKFLLELVPTAKLAVISFATESMMRRKKFFAKRNWIINFIEENFTIVDNFNTGNESYLIVKK